MFPTIMTDKTDDIFSPKLGRIRGQGAKRAKTYLNRVLHQISVAGGMDGGQASRHFTGYRIGRGNGAVRHRAAGYSSGPAYRRVVIKTRIVKFRGGNAGQRLGAARAHLGYIQRDGVAQGHEPGRLYDAGSDDADGKSFLARSDGDRHQFRFIVAPEDATEMEDMKPFVRDLMRTMESDLETRLDWVAVDHFNTAHPHTHIVLRGRDERDRDLVIARDYVAHGMRRRASELVTLELGPPTAQELHQKLERQIDQHRYTDIDRALTRDMADGVVDVRGGETGHTDARFRHAVRMGRLRVLEKRGLAIEVKPGRWHLSSKLESSLRRAGERGDIIKTMHRGLHQAGFDVGVSEFSIYDPADARAPVMTGRIIDRGLHDEMTDGHYVMIDASDGRAHYVALDPRHDMEDMPVGAIVEVHPASGARKPADRTIAEVARRHDGLYSPTVHQQFDPDASAEYIKAHVRRLEALRRENIVRRHNDGSWKIPEDFTTQVKTLATARSRYPGRIVVLSYLSLERQMGAEGATWLDRQLLEKEPHSISGNRFGTAMSEALQRREAKLIDLGLAERDGTAVRYHRNLLALLRRQELAETGDRLGKNMGLPFVEVGDGERVTGTYRRAVHLASGKFAVIEKSREFTLVAWRPALERYRDKTINGSMRGSVLSFDPGRSRGLGIG